jgi:uncharacterized protein
MSWALLQGRARFVSMVTFAIDPRALRGLVPAGTELDTFAGKAFLSVVALQFADNRVMGLPIPFARSYDQVNLRFYVKRQIDGGDWRHGVVFIRELVPVSALVSAGHIIYGEAYQRLPVTSRIRPPDAAARRPGRAIYRWRTDRHIHRLAADFSGQPQLPEPGSPEEFLVERYWGYVTRSSGLTREYRVDHPPWRIWPVVNAALSPEVAPLFGDRFTRALGSAPASVLVAEGSHMEVHRPVTLPSPEPAPVRA